MKSKFIYGIEVVLLVILYAINNPKIHAQSGGCTHSVGTGEVYTTIEEALSTIGTNGTGNVVCIKDNKIYGQTDINVSGSPTSYLIIKSHPQNSERPKFSTSEDVPVIKIIGSYLDIRGLEITNATKNSGFHIYNTHDIKLTDVKVKDVKDQGIWVDSSEDVLIDRCELESVSDSPEGRTDDLRIDNHSLRVTVSNCLIQKSKGKGGYSLGFEHADNIIFQNNELYGNNNPNVYIGNGDHIRIENNLISSVCNENNLNGEKATGSHISRFLADTTTVTNPKYKSDDVVINNNLIVNPNRGLRFSGCQNKLNYPDESCDFTETVISNNTLVGVGMNQSGDEGSEHAFFAEVGANASTDIEFRNNIMHTKNGTAPDFKLGVFAGDLTFSGNLWSDLTNLPPQGNQLITDWGAVFANNPNLTTCINNRINPDTYRVAVAYVGKGADVSRVGIGGGGDDSSPYPTPIVSPSTLPSPTPPVSWDLNTDGKINGFDFVLYVKGLGTLFTFNQAKDLIRELL